MTKESPSVSGDAKSTFDSVTDTFAPDLGASESGKPSNIDGNVDKGQKTDSKTGTHGFRMKIHPQQHARKRKRQPGTIDSTSMPSSISSKIKNTNVFGEEEEENQSRCRISMSLSGSSSSSDDEFVAVDKDNEGDISSDTNKVVADNFDSGKHPKQGNDPVSKTQTSADNNSASMDPGSIETSGKSSIQDSNFEVLGSGEKKTAPVKQSDNSTQRDGLQNRQKQKLQPEGWRVKLYRLNADGSWDDCGTGRILCLYKQRSIPQDTKNTEFSVLNQKSNTDPTIQSESNMQAGDNGQLSDSAVYVELGEPTLCMHSEVNLTSSSSLLQQQTTANNNKNSNPRILLRTRILLREAYQRQGDNIITWCEPYLEEGNPAQGVDLALSFQDNEGCIDIWQQITQVQSKANEKFRLRLQQQQAATIDPAIQSGNIETMTAKATMEGVVENGENRGPVVDIPRNVTTGEQTNLQRQELWVNVGSESVQREQRSQSNTHENDAHRRFEDAMGGIVAAYHDAAAPGGGNPMNTATPASPQLPNPPTTESLEEISDTVASVQNMHQRESLAMYISQNDCYYLKSLLSLFPPSEERGDLCSLTRLAACVKTILLLNDPSILEFVVNDELVFEDVCASLEYDPDLRDKANHRWFLRERAKFRTVVLMEDDDLIDAIHRSFRVNFLKDTLLRPTMDESSLSTLSSLQTFTHADVVKGVTMSPVEADDGGHLLRDSYLAKVIRMLGHEMDEICNFEWEELEGLEPGKDVHYLLAKRQEEDKFSDKSNVVVSRKCTTSQKTSTIWRQHLAPQDNSILSRRVRRRGSLSFLRELFNMVRVSLHQTDKDDFFAVLVSMEVDLAYVEKTTESKTGSRTNVSGGQSKGRSKPINFLSLLSMVLSDPETDVTEKGLVLEIIAGIAMHDPSLIRRKCLDFYASFKAQRLMDGPSQKIFRLARPRPNGKKQVIFLCPPNDLLASLLFLLAIETDAGVLLQVSEIMRIILDTDMMGENRPMNAGFEDEIEGVQRGGLGFEDDIEGIPPSGGHNPPHDQHSNPNGSGNTTSTEQNQFLLAFYEHYVQWLAAPFQYTILYPLLRFPADIFNGKRKSTITDTMLDRFQKEPYQREQILHTVPFSALRSSFAVELLSFCVRGHQYRMKMYLLRSRVLSNVLKLIKPSALPRNTSGDRCLKLAALRFLRAVLSVDEDLYHRHIIQDDLFGPVFEAFRANPVGDNLVSSSIVEMCDYINTKKINSLIEYIVTKHISATGIEAPVPSLEDVSTPYVSTLTCLRHAYETLVQERNSMKKNQSDGGVRTNSTLCRPRVVMNEKAIEDQRRFREADHEESYFDCDDDD